MLCPVVTPAELWQRTGRYEIPEVFKLEDRAGRAFVLPMTHEETFTFHATEIQSYRELPQILYHFATKDRDEPRPRGGLLRVREFIMKDSYSFDRAAEGMRGGSESIDYLAPASAATMPQTSRSPGASRERPTSPSAWMRHRRSRRPGSRRSRRSRSSSASPPRRRR